MINKLCVCWSCHNVTIFGSCHLSVDIIPMKIVGSFVNVLMLHLIHGEGILLQFWTGLQTQMPTFLVAIMIILEKS